MPGPTPSIDLLSRLSSSINVAASSVGELSSRPAPEGPAGPPASRIPGDIERRGRSISRVAPELSASLAASLGVRRILLGRSGGPRSQARFFPLATRRSSRPSPVRLSARPSSPEPTVDLRPGQRAADRPRPAISPSTVWRILDADAIKPWRYEYWIFPRDPRSPRRRGGSWTCTPALGRASRWAARTTSSARMRRRASRPASAATRRCRPARGGRCASNTSTSGAERCSTWPPGTSAAV